MSTQTIPPGQRIGVPREIFPGEKRVATVPEVVEKLIKLGFAVAIESGAGDAANFSDEAYRAVGAEVLPDAAALWAASDIVFKVRPPTPEEVGLLRGGGTLIGFVWPAQNPQLMEQLTAKKATVLAIDCLPRTLSRAQKMDALTSTAGVSGYRAVIDPAKLGLTFLAYVTVGLSSHTKKSQADFEAAMADAPEVRECHNLTGAIEYLLRVETADLASYKHFHTEVLGVLPQVHAITTYVLMESPKDERA